MKRAVRFGILIAGCIACAAIVCAFAQRAIARLDAALERTIIDRDVERLLALERSRQQFRALGELERDAILADAPEELAAIALKLESASIALEAQLHHYAGLMPNEDTPLLAAVGSASGRWLAVDLRVRAAALRNREEALALAKLHRFDADWEGAFDSLNRSNSQRLAQDVAQAEQEHIELVLSFVALVAAAASLGFAFGRRAAVASAARSIELQEARERVRPHSEMRLIVARPRADDETEPAPAPARSAPARASGRSN